MFVLAKDETDELVANCDQSSFSKINELWLFKGTKDERRYKAEFVGVKTRQELIDDYGYPATGKAHGEKLYLGVIKQTGDKGFYKISVSEE